MTRKLKTMRLDYVHLVCMSQCSTVHLLMCNCTFIITLRTWCESLLAMNGVTSAFVRRSTINCNLLIRAKIATMNCCVHKHNAMLSLPTQQKVSLFPSLCIIKNGMLEQRKRRKKTHFSNDLVLRCVMILSSIACMVES